MSFQNLFAVTVASMISIACAHAQSAPCGEGSRCAADQGVHAQRLQDAWDSPSTTAKQRKKMSEVISSRRTDAKTDWEKAAADYFAWRKEDQEKQIASAAALQRSKDQSTSLADMGIAPSNIMSGVQDIAQGYLKDPYSAQYQIGAVYPGYCKAGWLNGNGISWKGWAVNVLINARNSYGGYTGYQSHTVLFVGDQAVRIMEGENFGAHGPSKGFLGGGAGVCQIIKE